MQESPMLVTLPGMTMLVKVGAIIECRRCLQCSETAYGLDRDAMQFV